MLIIGFATNFELDADDDTVWTPKNSDPVRHLNWIDDESGYPDEARDFVLFFHSDGTNVLKQDHVAGVFQALDQVRNLEGYDEMCAESPFVNSEGKRTCRVLGITNFWDDSTAIYEESVSSDFMLAQQMSAPTFPNGAEAPQDSLFGFPAFDDNDILTFVQSYSVAIEFPDTDKAEDFESDAIDEMRDLDELWETQNEMRVEVMAWRSFEDE